MIVRGREYREVVLLSPNGPSKSSWHRHMTSCFRRRKFYGVGQRHADKEQRLIVELNGHFSLNGEAFDGRSFRDTDVLLRVTYVETDLRKCGNPEALIAGVIDEAYDEHRTRFPAAVIASEVETPTVEKITVDNIHSCSDAAPVVEAEAESRGTNGPSAKPPEPPPPCEHQWQSPVANIRRCIKCGHQEQTGFQAVGISRKQFFERGGSVSRYGRCG